MFQKLFIVYHLYLNNCYSDFYLFNIYNIPKTKITFRVKDIFFEFELTKLVILSEKTEFVIQNNLHEDVYIKIIDSDFPLNCKSHFIKAFLLTFLDNISMFYVLSKMPPIIEEQKLDSFISNEYACIKIKDNYIPVIMLNEFDDMCEVIYMSQNHTITNVSKDSLIRKPKIIFSKPSKNVYNYIIGEDNC